MYIELYNSNTNRAIVINVNDFEELVNTGEIELDFSIKFYIHLHPPFC